MEARAAATAVRKLGDRHVEAAHAHARPGIGSADGVVSVMASGVETGNAAAVIDHLGDVQANGCPDAALAIDLAGDQAIDPETRRRKA